MSKHRVRRSRLSGRSLGRSGGDIEVMTERLDATDWAILDAVSDSPESPVDIVCYLQYLQVPHERADVEARLVKLVSTGCLQTESADPVVYGLTSAGSEAWEYLGPRYSDQRLDWSEAWVVHLDYERGIGRITGTTRAICESVLFGESTIDGLEIERDTLSHETVEGFWAKYHRWLNGGHQVSFIFRSGAA